MKLLRTPVSLISLENVRRVEIEAKETKHTSHGTPYTLTSYSILIVYCGGNGTERLEFGNGANAKSLCDTTFNIIYEQLSKD